MSDPTIDAAAYAELQESAGEEFTRELVDTFLEEAPPMLELLRRALEAGEAERFRRTAHSLKSNGQTFGAVALTERARALELGGLEAGRAAGALPGLEQEYARVATALRELRDA